MQLSGSLWIKPGFSDSRPGPDAFYSNYADNTHGNNLLDQVNLSGFLYMWINLNHKNYN